MKNYWIHSVNKCSLGIYYVSGKANENGMNPALLGAHLCYKNEQLTTNIKNIIKPYESGHNEEYRG